MATASAVSLTPHILIHPAAISEENCVKVFVSRYAVAMEQSYSLYVSCNGTIPELNPNRRKAKKPDPALQ